MWRTILDISHLQKRFQLAYIVQSWITSDDINVTSLHPVFKTFLYVFVKKQNRLDFSCDGNVLYVFYI